MRAQLETFHRFASVALPPAANGLLAGGVQFEVPPGRILLCALGAEVQANAGTHVPRVVPGLSWRLQYKAKRSDNAVTQKITDTDDVPWTFTDGTPVARHVVPSAQSFIWSPYVSDYTAIPAGITAALISVRGVLINEDSPAELVALLLGGLR